MASPTINPELVTALKRLKLGRILDTLPERLVLADKKDMSLDDLMLLVLTDEIARRDSTAADNRARDAGLDPSMRLELWDKTAKVTFDKRMLSELVSLRFLEAHRHIVVLGPVGVGKTFVLQALGHIACRHGYNVRFVRADAMLRTLRQSRLDNSREAEMIALTSVDLLLVDDFALEPMSKEESKDVYQLFLERTGRASMIVSDNRDTAEWLAMFDQPSDRFLSADQNPSAFKGLPMRREGAKRIGSPAFTLATGGLADVIEGGLRTRGNRCRAKRIDQTRWLGRATRPHRSCCPADGRSRKGAEDRPSEKAAR
jgi:DNA replication protein DnaC